MRWIPIKTRKLRFYFASGNDKKKLGKMSIVPEIAGIREGRFCDLQRPPVFCGTPAAALEKSFRRGRREPTLIWKVPPATGLASNQWPKRPSYSARKASGLQFPKAGSPNPT